MAIDAITQCNLASSFTIRLEHRNGHCKFWEVRCHGTNVVTIQYGRIGDYGQTIYKDRQYFEKKAPQKIKKGYSIAHCQLGRES